MARRGTKGDVIAEVMAKHSLSEASGRAVVDTVLKSVMSVTQEHGMLILPHVGTFRIQKRRAHETRNPRTGDPMFVAARETIVFKQSREAK